MRVDALGLSISQDFDIPNTFFELLGRTVYVLRAVIRNDSPRSLWPSHIQFAGPTWELGIDLLKNLCGWKRLSGLPDYSDEIPGDGLLLNYRMTRRHTLFPGDSVKGVWMAMGRAPMPREYHDGDPVEVRLHVVRSKRPL